MKKLASLFAALVLMLALAAPGAAAAQTGRIYLYGETHADPACLEQELAAWDGYYHELGMRDLFIEVPSYTAQFMNLWMKAEDDAILSRLFEDWEGTAMHDQGVWDFYKSIKEQCPETVFHGFDVGHQYNTTGTRYLIGLALTGQMGSADWDETQQTIEQGKQYYQTGDDVYRENIMAENLARIFESLPMGASVMVITGSAHSNLYAMDPFTGTVPCMAGQLRQQYGAALQARNLSAGVSYTRAGDTELVALGGVDYTAVCLGEQDLTGLAPGYRSRAFWLVEGAYEAARALPATGEVLPCSNYLNPVEEGQVYRVVYTLEDGSAQTRYYRADGATYEGSPATTGFAA